MDNQVHPPQRAAQSQSNRRCMEGVASEEASTSRGYWEYCSISYEENEESEHHIERRSQSLPTCSLMHVRSARKQRAIAENEVSAGLKPFNKLYEQYILSRCINK